jgi:hypothetical protein
MLLRDNPLDIENRSFAVGSETTYTQEWGRRRSVVSVANQTAAARARFCLWIGPHAELLVEEKQITPHIPVIDKSKREEPNFKVPGSAQDDYTFGAQRDHDAHRPRRRSRAPFFRG